jgi:uncharacterized C2H2 Zn-finger protein
MASVDKNNDYWLHKCPYFSCTFAFFTRPDYKKHIETHKHGLDLRVSKCGFRKCKHMFVTKDDYNDHMQRIHGVLQEKKKPILAGN